MFHKYMQYIINDSGHESDIIEKKHKIVHPLKLKQSLNRMGLTLTKCICDSCQFEKNKGLHIEHSNVKRFSELLYTT